MKERTNEASETLIMTAQARILQAEPTTAGSVYSTPDAAAASACAHDAPRSEAGGGTRGDAGVLHIWGIPSVRDTSPNQQIFKEMKTRTGIINTVLWVLRHTSNEIFTNELRRREKNGSPAPSRGVRLPERASEIPWRAP